MRLFVRSLLNKQIAGEIGITETTGEFHRSNLMPEINAASWVDDRLNLGPEGSERS